MIVWIVLRVEYEWTAVEGVFASPSAAAVCVDRLQAQHREAYDARRMPVPIGGFGAYEALTLHVESHEVCE